MQHSGFVRFNDAPVVDKGRVILTSCRRNLSDAIRDMKLLVEILPQNSIMFQGGNNESHSTYVAGAVGAGGVVRVGDPERGGKGR